MLAILVAAIVATSPAPSWSPDPSPGPHLSARQALDAGLAILARQGPRRDVPHALALLAYATHGGGYSALPEAWYHIGRVHEAGDGVPVDLAKAVEAYRSCAIRTGSCEALDALGRLAERGVGEGDRKGAGAAWRYYRLSCSAEGKAAAARLKATFTPAELEAAKKLHVF